MIRLTLTILVGLFSLRGSGGAGPTGATGAAGESLKMSAPEVEAEKAINTEIECSATKDAIVTLRIIKKATALTETKVEVGGVVVAATRFKPAAAGQGQNVTFCVPRGKKWKVPTDAEVEKLFASYTFME